MKGLIAAGGSGTRLRPITHTSAKQLVPIANKPILFYGIEDMVKAGITQIGIVTGDTGEEIQQVTGNGSRWGIEITYLPQDAPRGLAHVVHIARDYLGDDDFVMYLGDNMLEQGIAELVDRFHETRVAARSPRLGEPVAEPRAQILLHEVDDPTQMGVAAFDDKGEITELVEKPAVPPSNLALVGIYLFDPTVHEAVRAIEPSERGELEITDAIQWLLDQGHRVCHEVLDGWWIDTGKKDPLLDCNRLVLEKLEPAVHGSVDDRSQIEGRVVIEAGAEVVNSTIRGPAIIGERTQIVDSYVGPFTSIYHDCLVSETEVEHSVVLQESRICGVGRVADSLIGKNVEVQRSRIRPKAARLELGDHSRVEID